MSYCVNPNCAKPQNPQINQFCQGCGFNLLLKERYRAIKLIGQGGFGKTFLAVDEGQSPLSPCVLKQLWTKNLSWEASQKAIALFQQEAVLLAELGKHPQIPASIAHFEQNGYLYLVQEFIEGTNLAKVVEEEGTLSEAQIWQLLDDLLPVLKFIHEHQVIHRDIKPENIIRRTSSPATPTLSQQEGQKETGGQGEPMQVGFDTHVRYHSRQGEMSPSPFPPASFGQLVLVDFGSAKLVTGLETLQSGTRIGSPEYVAPEQARGKAVFASDLYSLGVSCIYLLTDIPPFELFDVVNDRWAWRDYLTQDVSESLAQLLDKLLQNALTQRFQSADEVMQAIAEVRGKVRIKEGEMGRLPKSRQGDQVDALSDTPLQPPSILWQCLNTLTGNSAINSIAISPDGKMLASGNDDKTIRLWDLETEQVISTLTGHSHSVKSVTFSPDGTTLATGSDDQTIKLWNLSDFQEICTFSGHCHAVKSVTFSPDGSLLASGSWDKTIKLWNVHTGVEESTIAGHALQVASVAFSPWGNVLASASCDRTVRLWELPSRCLSTLYGHAWSVFAVAFSPDGKTLATGSDDNTIILWDWKTGKAIHTLTGHSWSVVALAFSPDGEILVSGSWDKTIKLWQVSIWEEIATLSGHSDSISSVAISRNGQIIASSSKDKSVKLWHRVG